MNFSQNPFKNFLNHSRRGQLVGWGKLIGLTGGAQILVQGLGMLSGILIIRLLSVEEYAYYTIANTMLGTMTVLADGGISAGVMAFGGEAWKDKNKLGEVVITGLYLRKRFGIVSLLVVGPILIYMLIDNGASPLLALTIFIGLMPNFFAALSDSLYQIPFKLKQDLVPLQKNQIMVNMARLFLNGLSLIFFPFAFVALLCNAFPRLYGNFKLRKLLDNSIKFTASVNQEYKTGILKIVKRSLPGAIYYCVSGQITIFILANYGNSNNVASYGALSRIGMTVSLLSVLALTLLTPRFARLEESKRLLLSRYITYFVLIIVVSFLFLLGSFLLSDYLLLLIGKKYAGLNIELVLVMLISLLSLISGFLNSLNTSRGWVVHPGLLIIVNLASILFFGFYFDVSNLLGAIYFQIGILIISIILNASYGLFKIIK